MKRCIYRAEGKDQAETAEIWRLPEVSHGLAAAMERLEVDQLSLFADGNRFYLYYECLREKAVTPEQLLMAACERLAVWPGGETVMEPETEIETKMVMETQTKTETKMGTELEKQVEKGMEQETKMGMGMGTEQETKTGTQTQTKMETERRWAPMTDIFHYHQPAPGTVWRHPGRLTEPYGRLARLKPEEAASYIYHHYQYQEEKPGDGDKYGMIGLHENLLFFYSEQPATLEPAAYPGKLNTSLKPERWAEAMEPHFIPWTGVPAGQELWRKLELVLHAAFDRMEEETRCVIRYA